MTRNDTAKILSVLKAAYPQFYKGMNREEAESVLALWAEMFSDDPVQTVAIAVKALIATDTKGFPPHIGAVKEQIARLNQGASGRMSEQEAWNTVRKAIAGRGTYGERFLRMPLSVQKIVGSPAVLKEWGMVDIQAFNTVVASNFMRSYKARAAHQSDLEKLPADVVQALMQSGGDREKFVIVASAEPIGRDFTERTYSDDFYDKLFETPKAEQGEQAEP